MRRWCIFKNTVFSFFDCVVSLMPAPFIYIFFYYARQTVAPPVSLSRPVHTSLHLSVSLIASSFSIPLWLFFSAEPEEKQREILNNTIPEGKDSGDLLVFTLLSARQCAACHFAVSLLDWIGWIFTGSLVFSEVCRWLPRPVVWGDGASRQRGAAQCGGVSVRLQGGAWLWRPGDSGLWHEGNTSEKWISQHYV